MAEPDMSVELKNILPEDLTRYIAICKRLGCDFEPFLVRAITKCAEEWEETFLFIDT